MSSGSHPILELHPVHVWAVTDKRQGTLWHFTTTKSEKHAKTARKQKQAKNTMGGVYARGTQQSQRRSLRTSIVLELKEPNVEPTPMRAHIPQGIPRAKKPAIHRATARSKAKKTCRNYEPPWTKDKMCQENNRDWAENHTSMPGVGNAWNFLLRQHHDIMT